MGNHNLHDWTIARLEELQSLWVRGWSGGQIAAKLGITRSSVLGKAARMGLRKTRKAKERPWEAEGVSERQWYRRRHQRLPHPRRDPIQREPKPAPVEAMPANPVTLLQLEYHHCRWPLGEPSADMLYCGAQKHGDRSYCAEHMRKATAQAYWYMLGA